MPKPARVCFQTPLLKLQPMDPWRISKRARKKRALTLPSKKPKRKKKKKKVGRSSSGGNHSYARKISRVIQEMHEQISGRNVVASLKACADRKDLREGTKIHADVVRTGLLQKDVFVGSTLVSMYGKCGSLTRAQEVFDKLPIRNVISWNALLTGYAQCGRCMEALSCFQRMQLEGMSPNAITFVCILKGCGSIGASQKGLEVHAGIVGQLLLEKDVLVGTALVHMYAKCGLVGKAQEVFDKLSCRDVVLWSTLIAGYAQQAHLEEALSCFQQMQFEGISPDVGTFVCILKACGSIGDSCKAQGIHAEIVGEGLLRKHLHVGTALVDMYAKCGFLVKAQKVFEDLPVRDVVVWSALIAGHAQQGNGEEALNCFELMQLEGLSPNEVTCVCCLKACGSLGALNKGQEIHARIGREGLAEKHINVGNALVDMYSKCGLLAKAQEVFESLLNRDIVSWNVLIAGYLQRENGEEALNCLERMQHEGTSPDEVTFACILKACGSTGAADKGQQIHAEIVREKLLGKHILLGNALVDMYGKCGLLRKAQEVFCELPHRNEATWNALITGYALLGKAENVFYLFGKMIGDGIKPDKVTFISLLNVCSHTGLLDKGLIYFKTMIEVYAIIPTLEHFACMIDLFSRAGHLEKVVAISKRMPFSANIAVLHTVLSACQKMGSTEIGSIAFEHALQVDEKDVASYICMSNIFSDVGRHTNDEALCL